MGHRSATLNTRLRRTRAGAFYATLRACFFAGDTPVAQHAVYFPDAFLTQMREAMPSTLSFDEFISACQRPLRRSIRINTLKISVADFLAGGQFDAAGRGPVRR